MPSMLHARTRCEDSPVTLSPWTLQGPRTHLSSRFSPNLRKRRVACAELWYKAVIDVCGNVLLCCNDYLRSTMFGNIRTQKMHDIRNSELIKRTRQMRLRNEFERLTSVRNAWSGALSKICILISRRN